MDGYTATRLLRESGMQAPIFALTADAMKGFEQKVLAAGCTAFLTKPVDIDRLIETLARTLGGKRVDTPKAVAAAAPVAAVASPLHAVASADAPADTAAADATPIVSLLANRPRLHPALRKFATRLGTQIDAMEAAASNQDFDALASLAHWLKGAGGTVGYDVFTDPAQALEHLARARAGTQIIGAISQLRGFQRRLVVPDTDADVPAAARGQTAGKTAPPARAPLAAVPPAVTAAPAAPPIISRLAGKPRLRPTLRKFAERLGEQLTAMEAARRDGNFDELAQLAHWLKGAGGTVGYDAFTEPAVRLEQLVLARDTGGIPAALAELRALAGRMVVPADEETLKTAAG